MKRFAALFAALDQHNATSAKLAALKDYFAAAEASDAAWAVYFLTGNRPRQVVNSTRLKLLAAETAALPLWLFEECYDAVGDLGETIAHLLPPTAASNDATFSAWVEQRLLPLRAMSDDERGERIRDAWSVLDWTGRFVWNKLITGSFRVGVSKSLVVRALAEVAALDAKLVAHRLAGTWQPSADAFRALIDVGDGAAAVAPSQPYPLFLAHQLDDGPAVLGDIADWQAEWKWDGIRGQLVRRSGEVHIWSRGDELVTETFPEIAAAARALPDGTVLDGELLPWRDDAPLSFAILQKRLGRKAPGKKMLLDAPVVFVAYDLLENDGRDCRATPLVERRALLDRLLADVPLPITRSPLIEAATWEALATLREESRGRGVEGMMLKRKSSAYGVGRPRGDWWKWKIDPYAIDAVIVYAQRGHGRRASLYTDYTFAVWDGPQLVPFAKAYSGLTDAEIREVDAFIRRNTLEKFGPVRTVKPELVCELAFEGIQRSKRHKSGLAVRFPRIAHLRRDKKPEEADTLATLHAMAGFADLRAPVVATAS